LSTRVVGISADDPSASLAATIRRILSGLEQLVAAPPGLLADATIEVDDTFVGEGYGISTEASIEAIELCARQEAVFLDPTYTSKAMAGLIARIRRREFVSGTILFWHTGGQVGLFA
jgi:1-aminocyclopropane-1-carboxylate deaminase/D-cysteine desulfhydrase-like pyridoxal-dependent ACC family enzyme